MEGTLAQMLKSRRFDVNIIFTYNLALCLLFPRLLLRLVNMGFQWFSVTLCYYGLSFASTNLSQHVWTDFLLRNHQPDSEGRQICKLQLVLVYDKYILLMSYNGCWRWGVVCSVSLLRSPAICSAWWPSTGSAGDLSSPSVRSSQDIILSLNTWLPSDRLWPLLYCLRLPPALQRQQRHQSHQAPPLSAGEVWSLGSLRYCLPLHCWALPNLHQEPVRGSVCPHGQDGKFVVIGEIFYQIRTDVNNNNKVNNRNE